MTQQIQLLVDVGTTWQKVLVDGLTRTQIVQFAGASGDYNPLHTDEVYAREVANFPSVFAHGMLTMSIAGQYLSELFGTENVTRFSSRFKGQVWPGDSLKALVEVTGIDVTEESPILRISIVLINQHETEVLQGSATIKR